MSDDEMRKNGKAGMFPGGICLVSADEAERLLRVNEGLVRLLGYSSPEEILALSGGRFQGLVAGGDYVPLKRIYGEGEDGLSRYFHFHLSAVFRKDCLMNCLLSMEDHEVYGKVWALYLQPGRDGDFSPSGGGRDQLTGLPEYREFYRMSSEMAKRDRRNHRFGHYACVHINIKNFKLYNTSHGSEAGDRLLRRMAEILKAAFPGCEMTRLSGDRFELLPPAENLENKLKEIWKSLSLEAGDPSISMKAGIVLFRKDAAEEEALSCRDNFDRARMAADFIYHDADRLWAVYDQTMEKELHDRAFILQNFERAMAEGHIKVFYQGVIRLLNGKLCSAEALVRWEDPERGMIYPSLFVPVLEEARLIPKLDCFIIEEVARHLRYLIDNGLDYVPVSVNFSRVDFDSIKPFEFVEGIVRKYRLARHLFCIEVTESALTEDGGKLHEEIGRFRMAGYQCWLDDFGSGYSSLNVLQKFHFDELKLDRAFLTNFNEKSRRILKSIVLMAKSLSIHTLAEGVETEEEVRFLREIGCEKIQGFYFGKPMSYREGMNHFRDHHFIPETTMEAALYEKAGLVNVMTGTPLALFAFDGRGMTLLYGNKEYFRNTRKTGLPGAEGPVKADSCPLAEKLYGLVEKALETRRAEFLNDVSGGRYLVCRVRILASKNDLALGQLEIYSLSHQVETEEVSRLDRIMRNTLPLYTGIYLYHGASGRIETVNSRLLPVKPGDQVPLSDWLEQVKLVHEEDRSRFLKFIRPETMAERLNHSPGGIVTAFFRLQERDGSYRWKRMDVISLTHEERADFLLCVKNAALSDMEDRDEVLPAMMKSLGLSPEKQVREGVSAESVLKALRQSEDLRLFWKDRDRKFLGVTKGFLNAYGLPGEEGLLGKTDEDVGWHVDNEPYKNLEEKVLSRGIPTLHEPGECIIKGRPHRISSSKFPIYEGNRIVGLVGYFIDEEDREELENNVRAGMIDERTGLLSFRGMLSVGISYMDNLRTHGEDFIAVLIHVPEFKDVAKAYGGEIERKLVRRIADIMLSIYPEKESLAYLGGGHFLVFVKYKENPTMRKSLLHLGEYIHNIHEVDGCNVTLYMQYGLAYGSESDTLDDMLHILLTRLRDAETRKYGEAVFIGDRISFLKDAFDSTPELILMADQETYQLLYANRAALKERNLPEDYDYTKDTCHKFFYGRDTPCTDCPRDLIRQDRFFVRDDHNDYLNGDYFIRHTLVPWQGKNCHFEMATNMSRFEDRNRRNDLIYQEAAVNEAIERGLQEKDPEKGLQKLLARMGEILEAERVLVLEESGDTMVNTFEWHGEGLAPAGISGKKLPRKHFQPVYDNFDASGIAILRDVPEVLKKYGLNRTSVPGLSRLLAGHLISAGKSLGILEVVNPGRRASDEVSPLIGTLTRFAAILLRHRDDFRRLNDLSTRDQLTGEGNRRAFLRYVRNLPAGRKITIIFGDMNGLKHINDTKGHEAGDRAIIGAATIMEKAVGRDHLFRMGGDEFILAVEGREEKEIQDLMSRLREEFTKAGISMALGMAFRLSPITDIDQLITEADGAMYRDKRKRMYTSYPLLSSREL